jgi:hypothetical protein
MRFVPGRSLAAELERVRQQRAPVDATGLPPRSAPRGDSIRQGSIVA